MDFPRTFKDTLGRPWTVDITLAALKRAKLFAGFDIDAEIAIPEPKPGASLTEKDEAAQASMRPIQALLDDQIRFSNVLYAILKPQIDKAGLGQEEFDDGLGGECIENAQLAFVSGLHDFFPSHSPKRQMIRGVMEAKARTIKLMKKTQVKREKVTEEAVQMMDREFQTAMKAADEALDAASSKLASDSPGEAA
jgi:hypothetical protein